jgi:hypothetical protein
MAGLDRRLLVQGQGIAGSRSGTVWRLAVGDERAIRLRVGVVSYLGKKSV